MRVGLCSPFLCDPCCADLDPCDDRPLDAHSGVDPLVVLPALLVFVDAPRPDALPFDVRLDEFDSEQTDPIRLEEEVLQDRAFEWCNDADRCDCDMDSDIRAETFWPTEANSVFEEYETSPAIERTKPRQTNEKKVVN